MLKNIALLSPLLITFYGALVLLATTNKNRKNRYYLGLFFGNSFLLFVGHFLSFFNYWHIFKYFDFIFLTALLLFYPLFYFYIKSAFGLSLLPSKKIIHFIPAIIILVMMGVLTYFAPWQYYQQYMNYTLHNTPVENSLAKTIVVVYKLARYTHLLQILIYNYIILHFMWRAYKGINNLFSNLDSFQVKGFYTIVFSFLLFMALPGFYVTLLGRTPFQANVWMLFIVCSLFSLLYIILSIIGINQKPVVHLEEVSFQNEDFNHITQEQELHHLEDVLKTYFKEQKPWLNPNLHIWDVAKAIGTNRSYVSKIINEQLGLHFNDFVNLYRINEAKYLLQHKKEYSIHRVADLVGFGSVGTFIRTFKKFENCTPNKFKTKKV